MDDETPLQLIKTRSLRTKNDVTLRCIIHCCSTKATSKVTPLTDTSFKKIKETCHLRARTGSNQFNYDIIAKNIPEKFLKYVHGYHRVCYQKFTNISGILKREASSSSEYPQKPLKRRRPCTGVLFPKDECLFCQKHRKKRKGKEEPLTRCQTVASSDLIKETALAKHDFVLQAKVNDTDLVAREAYYHRSCYRDFIKDDVRNTVQARGDEEAKKVHDAHAAAFQFLSEHIQRSIIDESNVERVGMLREKYLRYMQQHYPDQYNPDYKTDKLKEKITSTFGNKITFWQPNYRSDLVYSTYILGGQAVETAFQAAASESRRLEEAAMHLRRSIFDAHREARDMPWPPPPGNVLKDWEFPPEQLSNFLSVLLVGKKKDKLSTDQSRRIMSICHDILYAVTNGRWIQSKHILLAMSICHLTGRADIIRLINRFGHCISYSKLLEILTAIHIVTTDHSSNIPPGIHTEGNQVVHFCWDNFDLNEETPSGAGTTHSTHGIIIQETDPTLSQVAPTFPSVEKTKKRSLTPETAVMEPCFVKRMEPNIPKPQANAAPQNESSSENDILWVLARHLNQDEQIVPGWGGWISLTGEGGEERKTTIEYMPPVNAPITDNATVKHIIRTSQEMTAAIGQPYTIITFDLAAAKKAYEITWSNPERYDKVIIRLGAFHTACTYIGALGKHMKGSGIEDVMVESSVCASGSIEKVLSGKHYNRARYVLRTTVEALERLLLASFQDEEDERLGEEEIKLISNVAHNPSSKALAAVKKIPEWKRWMEKYDQYKSKIRNGEKGKTAQFWVCFMDKVWLLMQFLKATKTNDLTLHIQCLQQMCSLFFSQDKQNYARYTSVYVNNLLALPQTHPGAFELLEEKGMSVNRSEVPNSRNAVDITIEQTYNRHASGHGPGIIGFSRNVAAYHRWSSTRHARAEYLQATLNSAGLETDEASSHKDVNPSEITKGEHIVKKMVNAFQNFMNPFSVPDDSKLYCISSGRPISKEVEADLLQVDDHGTKAYKAFIQERLVEKSVSIHAPIKRQNLKTFVSTAQKTSVTSSTKKTKEIVAERNVFGQLILLAMTNEICMEKVMTFPLGPIPWSLATADGAPIKTDKSKLLHKLEQGHTLTERPESPLHVIDGNAVIQALSQVPETFGKLAERIFLQLPKAPRVDFVTDTYKENSIKNVERERRGTSQKLLIQGPLTKVPRDFKQFLANSSNKTQLLNLILREWQTDKYAKKLQGRQVMFVCGENCWKLTSKDGYKTDVQEVPNLQSTQEEADTRIILHCLDIATQFPNSGGIVVRSPDTDVFLLLMRNALSIPVPLVMDTGVANKRRMININAAVKSVGEDICKVLLPFHAFTGCDTTSAFVRKGKIGPLRLLQKNPRHIKTFAALGNSPCPSAELCKELEAFTCMMYGARSGVQDINRLRYTMFMTKYTPKNQLLSSDTGIDTSLLPPCRSSLKMHILRVNYQTMIWNLASVQYPELPQPYDGQGWEMKGQTLCYKWVDGDILPKELVDLTMEQDAKDTENEYFSIQDVIDDTDEEDEEEDVDEDN